MASAANNQTITTTAVRVFTAEDDGGPCTTFRVHCRTGSAAPVLVNVPTLHKAGELIAVNASETQDFTLGPMGITEVNLQGSGGSATVDFGVADKTPNN